LRFTDIEGSTGLGRCLRPVRWRDAVGDDHAVISEAIANGEHVDHAERDAFIALFPDALAAVLARGRGAEAPGCAPAGPRDWDRWKVGWACT
jgi:class 3 adenylate cyclase